MNVFSLNSSLTGRSGSTFPEVLIRASFLNQWRRHRDGWKPSRSALSFGWENRRRSSTRTLCLRGVPQNILARSTMRYLCAQMKSSHFLRRLSIILMSRFQTRRLSQCTSSHDSQKRTSQWYLAGMEEMSCSEGTSAIGFLCFLHIIGAFLIYFVQG